MPKHTPEQRKKKAEAFESQRVLGAKMKIERILSGLKLYYVAGKMGITESYLSYLEAGKRPWPDDLKQSFLRILKTESTNNRKVKKNGSPK